MERSRAVNKPTSLPDGYHLTEHVTVREIQAAVAEHFGIPEIEMVSARRNRRVARPRQNAMYLARDLTPYSFPNIGRFFGNRDHTTVLYAVGKIEQLKSEDKKLAESIGSLKLQICAYSGDKSRLSIVSASVAGA